MKADLSKPETMWVVLNSAGKPHMHTLKYYRKTSIEEFNKFWVKPFKYWYRKGFRCVKVEVTIKEVQS